MAQPINVSNENDYVRWEKISCHTYRWTNKTTGILQLKVWKLEGQDNNLPYNRRWVVQTDIPAQSYYDLDIMYDTNRPLPAGVLGDGVYEFEVTTYGLTVTSQEVLTPTRLSFAQIPLPKIGTQTIIKTDFGNTTPVNITLVNMPAAGNNLVSQLQAQGFTAVLVAPNQLPPISYLPTLTEWSIVVTHPTANVQNIQWRDAFNQQQLLNIDNDCVWSVAESDKQYIIAINVGLPTPVNILDKPYDVINDLPLLQSYLQDWVDSVGGGVALPPPNGLFIFENCQWIVSVVLADGSLGDVVVAREYITELCDTYVCYNNLLREYLCAHDPCCKACSDQKKKEELLDKLNHFGMLLMVAMQALVAQDRLWFLNGFTSPDYRIQNITRQVNLFERLSRLAKLCGYCEPEKKCGC